MTTRPSRLERLRGARWVGAGLLDQVVIASANAGNTLLGPVLFERTRAGVMMLSLGLGYLAMYLNRALVGDVLIALGSRYEDARRDRLVRNGLATAFLAGVAGAIIFVVAWLVVPRDADTDLRDLVWLAPLLPMVMLHDTARCSYLAARQPERALVIDLVWVGTQALIVAGLVVTGNATPGGLLFAWTLGAAVGATVFFARTRLKPWRGSPRAWLAETRHLAGWFTATAVIGQVQVQVVTFLVAIRLSAHEVPGLRIVQTVIMQPVQNFITAVQGLIVPRNSRNARDAARLPGAEGEAAGRALRRQTVQLAFGFAALGGLLVAVAWPAGRLVLGHIPKYADVAPLALPISLQGAIYLVQVPFTAALRGMHRARMLFLQYLIFSATSLTGLMIGAGDRGLAGATWGLTIGSFVGLLTMIGLYWYSLRYLGETEPELAVEEEITGST